jgi:hypothetical protein
LVEGVTKEARMCLDYGDVEFFREHYLQELADANYPTHDLDRLALRTAFLNILKVARFEANIQCIDEAKDETKRQYVIKRLNERKSDAIRLADELGLDSGATSPKIDSLIELYKDRNALMRKWYPNPIKRTYVKIRETIGNY